MMEELDPSRFEEQVSGAKIVLLDFWATWCRPCKAIEPHLAAIAEEFADKGVKVLRLNADAYPETVARFGVFSLPTVLFFKEGKLVDKIVGARPKSDFTKLIEELLD
ncbi:MAG: thioredoxin [candidate division WOR-3 bacterium]